MNPLAIQALAALLADVVMRVVERIWPAKTRYERQLEDTVAVVRRQAEVPQPTPEDVKRRLDDGSF